MTTDPTPPARTPGATPTISAMRVVPVAGRDGMLLNLSGAHAPWFTRNLVILTDSSGQQGVGEVPGGERIRQTLEDARALVVGRPGWGALIRYELILMLCSSMPGALGLVLRRKLYPLLLGTGLTSFSVAPAKFDDIKCDLMHRDISGGRDLLAAYTAGTSKRDADKFFQQFL